MTHTLMPNKQAPELSLSLVGGGDWCLSKQEPENFTMIIFYRGLHCPVCKSYLGKLNAMMNDILDLGFSVIVASMDPLKRAEQAKEEWGLDRLKVAYGLEIETAKKWGLYISKSIKDSENSVFSEPGLIWVRPDGTLYLIDISNMPWARPELETLMPKAKFAVENNYPARGNADT
ncbi:MAG: redoxin domain-containing protein [Hyphomicrobiales bacterium]|jgi:peroxiredoxin|nr:redoxin domain-containing protein [Hyphomicrobiales bacterium]